MNSLYGTPQTGLQGAQFQLDVTANNIANLNTSGFQEVESQVESLPLQGAIAPPQDPTGTLPATRVGIGVRPISTMRSQAQAPLVATGNSLDLAIQGSGLFSLRQPNGQIAYAQQVSLHVEPDGRLATPQGLLLVPPIRVAANVMQVTADDKGVLQGVTTGGKTVALGTLRVTTFASPENLSAVGGGLYTETLGSGRPQTGGAAQSRIFSGYQLGSTVDLAAEMSNMVADQQEYAINAKALQTMDSLVNTIVNLSPR